MESFDGQQFRRLGEDSIADCLALSAEAGWNQTREDWELFLRHGTVFGLLDGRAVATGAVLPYSDRFAWISMVLVTASRRRAKIGTRILQTCCAETARIGLLPVLDATPAGERVYRPLGFEAMFNISRWQGHAAGRDKPPAGVRAMTAADVSSVIAIDAAAFGARRGFLVESLLRRAPQIAFVTEDLSGYVLARPGRIATQIGPVVAADAAAADALLDAALRFASGPVFIDIIHRKDNQAGLLQRHGFTVQRPFARMGLNCHAPFGNPARLFAIAGPEFG